MWDVELTPEQENILFEAWAFCDMEDKSTEFMLEYMQDKAEADLDSVLAFMQDNSSKRKQWYQDNPNWFEKYK